MTVAQLVHSTYGRTPHLPDEPFRTLRRAVSRRWSCDAALWSAIGTGLGFAVIGLAMMVLAIGAAGVAPAAQAPQGDGLALTQPAPAQHAEVYHWSGSTLIGAMPVP